MSLMLVLGAMFVLSDISEPVQWIEKPQSTEDDFPSMAADLKIAGYATVQCQINPQGIPVNCIALSARPAHLGFEVAAVNVVQRGRLSPHSSEALPNFTTDVPFITTDWPNSPEWNGPEPNSGQLRSARERTMRMTRNMSPMKTRMARTWQIERLPATSQTALSQWLDEYTPSAQQERHNLTIAAARTLVNRNLETFPTQEPADWDQWSREISQARPDDRAVILKNIRNRYCSVFDCTSGELPR